MNRTPAAEPFEDEPITGDADQAANYQQITFRAEANRDSLDHIKFTPDGHRAGNSLRTRSGQGRLRDAGHVRTA